MSWDVNLIDLLLYLVTPIVLAITAVILIFTSPSLSAAATKNSINCFMPAEFSNNWIDYGHKYCLSGHAELYEDLNLNIPLSNLTEFDLDELYHPVR